MLAYHMHPLAAVTVVVADLFERSPHQWTQHTLALITALAHIANPAKRTTMSFQTTQENTPVLRNGVVK